MNSKLSKRLQDIVLALPLQVGIRVLEIGCGSGAMAREISKRIGTGYILGIDRSEKAIQQAIASSQKEITAGTLSFRKVAVENFELDPAEELFDLSIAVRVGALDGRHPELERHSLLNIAKAMTSKGRLFIDGGNPIKEIPLDEIRKLALKK
ncbi:MAG: class I SAM-dependent methyltransferase [Cyclobacteriaceae bacterium]